MTIEELKSKVGANHFTLLGIPRCYAINADLMKKNYLAMSRTAHPDFFTNDPDMMADAMSISAAINDAYRTLEDPVRRAEYILLTHGGKDAGQDKRVPAEMLGEVLMLNEEIADARAANDSATLATFRTQMQTRHASILKEIATLATRLTDGPNPAEKGDPETLDALRLQLNAMKYVQNLLAQLPS